MPVYYNNAPTQYALAQQSRGDEMIRQLLNMFMQMKLLERKEGQWEKEHELGERRTRAYEQDVETRRRYEERPPTPEKPSAFMEKFTTFQQLGVDPKTAALRAIGVHPRRTLEEIEAESEAGARGAGTGKFGRDPDKEFRGELADINTYYSRERARIIREFNLNSTNIIFSKDPEMKKMFLEAKNEALEALDKEKEKEIVLTKSLYGKGEIRVITEGPNKGTWQKTGVDTWTKIK